MAAVSKKFYRWTTRRALSRTKIEVRILTFYSRKILIFLYKVSLKVIKLPKQKLTRQRLYIKFLQMLYPSIRHFKIFVIIILLNKQGPKYFF